MSDKTATQLLGTEKITTLLIRYAVPSIIAMTASSIYNIADSIFIGHGVGPLAISAMAITLPLMNLAAAFGAMVGIGASSLLSIKLGQQDTKSARTILINAFMLNIILGLSFGIICLIFLDPILYSFGASDATIGYARDYMRIILMGNVFTHVYLGLNNILRATGYPSKSMRIIVTAVIINCILDYIFIFILDWGIKGAAWATVIAQFTAMILELAHFLNPKLEIGLRKGVFRFRKKIVKGIFSIGLAPFLMNITASVVVIFINNALRNNGGDIYIGAYGIVNRVLLIFGMVVFGLNQGMQPIIGYNYGANNVNRVRLTLRLVIIAATCVTSFGFLLGMLIPKTVSMLFTTDPTLLAVSEQGLRIATLAFPVIGFQMVTSSFFQSIGMAHKAIFLSLTRQLIFLIPLLIILPPIFGSNGVWMSMPIADIFSTILALVLLLNQIKKFRRQDALNTMA